MNFWVLTVFLPFIFLQTNCFLALLLYTAMTVCFKQPLCPISPALQESFSQTSKHFVLMEHQSERRLASSSIELATKLSEENRPTETIDVNCHLKLTANSFTVDNSFNYFQTCITKQLNSSSLYVNLLRRCRQSVSCSWANCNLRVLQIIIFNPATTAKWPHVY